MIIRSHGAELPAQAFQKKGLHRPRGQDEPGKHLAAVLFGQPSGHL